MDRQAALRTAFHAADASRNLIHLDKREIESVNQAESTPQAAWDFSAFSYGRFVTSYPMYRFANQALVKRAQIEPGMQVLDLGCGTGSTTLVILEELQGKGMVYAVDFSLEMLKLARRKVNDPQVCFIQCGAESFALTARQTLDRVVCGAAFWLFGDKRKVLREIRSVMKSEGCFAFNLPDRVLRHRRHEKRSTSRSLGYREAMICRNKSSYRFNCDHLRELLSSAGFTLVTIDKVSREPSYAELIAYYRIPIITKDMFPGVPYRARLKLAERLIAGWTDDDIPPQIWVNFLARSTR